MSGVVEAFISLLYSSMDNPSGVLERLVENGIGIFPILDGETVRPGAPA